MSTEYLVKIKELVTHEVLVETEDGTAEETIYAIAEKTLQDSEDEMTIYDREFTGEYEIEELD